MVTVLLTKLSSNPNTISPGPSFFPSTYWQLKRWPDWSISTLSFNSFNSNTWDFTYGDTVNEASVVQFLITIPKKVFSISHTLNTKNLIIQCYDNLVFEP